MTSRAAAAWSEDSPGLRRAGEATALAPDPIVVLDDSFVIHDVNEAACTMAGMPRDEIVGRPMLDFVHSGDLELAAEGIAYLEEHGGSRYLLVRVKTASGWRNCDIHARGISSPLKGFALSMRDLDQRRIFARPVDEDPEQLRALLHNASDALLLVDASGGIEFASLASTRLFRMWPADLATAKISDLVIPEDRLALDTAIETVASGSEPSRSLDVRVRVDERRVITVGLNLSGTSAGPVLSSEIPPPLSGDAGTFAPETSNIVISARDVTEERAAARRQEAIVSGAATGIAIVDPQGRLRRVNPSLAAMLATSVEELTDAKVDDWILPVEDRRDQGGGDVGFSRPELALRPGETWKGPRRLNTGTGAERWAVVAASAVATTDGPARPDRPGDVVGEIEIVLHLTDITSEKEDEAALQTMTDALSEGLVVFDERGLPLLVNPAVHRIFGQEEDAFRQTLPARLLSLRDEHGRLLEEHEFPAAHTLATGEELDQVLLQAQNETDDVLWLSMTTRRMLRGRAMVVVLSLTDVTAQRRLESRLRHDANHDALTGLPNRALAERRLRRALSRSSRTTAVLFIDLDRFKTVNDRFGHSAGDEVLRAVARRLRRTKRVDDTAARLGGDEFVVICPDLPRPADARRLADRMLAELLSPIDIGRDEPTPITVGASIGIALSNGTDTPEDLMAAADTLLYEAKRRGGGVVSPRHEPADGRIE